MSKPKPDAPKSWEDIDDLLRDIGELQSKGDVLAAEYNLKANALKEEYEKKAADIDKEIKAKATKLKSYVKKHKGEIASDDKKGRTKTMIFGKVGVRASSKIVIPDEQATVKLLQSLRLYNCIITKEVPNREALENYDDATLIAVGARREPQESTWYEVGRENFGNLAKR